MLTLMSIVVPLFVGGLATWLAHQYKFRNHYGQPARITGPEYALGAMVSVVLAVLVTQLIGPNLSRENAINGYNEFYNGSVTQAVIDETKCVRDGSCRYEYDCDPYIHIHETSSTDSQGNVTTSSYTETHYHECPYADRERRYNLKTNIGLTIPIGDVHFPPDVRPYRSGRGLPGNVPRDIPVRWLQAKANLAAGSSEPVTGVFKYPNYILASDDELLEEYGGSIANYKKAGLLPKHTARLGDDKMLYDYGMRASKMQAVGGLKVANLPQWQDRLMRFNAALGSDNQGDLHVVVVPASRVSDPEDYITALKAYWTNLGKWSISKNGIILALGISPDGKTVEWSHAQTGMPVGNEEMLEALKLRPRGMTFDPNNLFGKITTNVYQEGKKLKVKYDHTASGEIGKIMFADFPYKRPCMECNDAEDKGVGYVDLKDQVPVTTGAKVWMFVIVLVLSGIFWGLMLAFDPFKAIIPSGSNRRHGSSGPFGRY